MAARGRASHGRATMTGLPTPRFDRFYRYDELTACCSDYAVRGAGSGAGAVDRASHEGREIWLVATVTNVATGDDEDKPAFWVDGNIHAAELTASTACLYWLHQLVQAMAATAGDRAARHARGLPGARA
jgi:hypothetical protein